MTSKHKTCTWLLAGDQARASPEVTLYLSSTSTLAQCYLNFGILHSSVASPIFLFEVSQDVIRNEVIYMIVNVVLRFFDSRYKVSPRLSHQTIQTKNIPKRKNKTVSNKSNDQMSNETYFWKVSLIENMGQASKILFFI